MYIWVCASNQNHSSCNSPIVVTPQGVEFPCIVLEFQEYYNEEERRWNPKTREDKVEVYTKFLNYKLEKE